MIAILYVAVISESQLSETVAVIEAVKQSYQPMPELLQMMETFRQMVNDCPTWYALLFVADVAQQEHEPIM